MLTFRPFLSPLQSLAFPLRIRALPRVCAQLPLVRQLLAVVGDPVAFVGGAFSAVRDPLASHQLDLVPRDHLLALVKLRSTAIEFAASVFCPFANHGLP